METGSAIIIFIFLIGICYIIYDSIPSKYTKLEESFGGFMNRSLVRFEYENSRLHTIVYGGTGTGRTCLIRQYLKLYLDPRSGYTDQNQNQNQDQGQDQGSNLVNHELSWFTDLRSSFTDYTEVILRSAKRLHRSKPKQKPRPRPRSGK